MKTLYPDVRRFLQKTWEECRGAPIQKLSVREAAKIVNVSHSALYSWLHGERAPRDKTIKRLGEFFYADDAAKQEVFGAAMRSAIRDAPNGSPSDPVKGIIEGTRKLKVGVLKYNPFGGGQHRFFDEVVSDFMHFAGLDSVGTLEYIDLHDAELRLCKQGGVDIIIGIFATPDRTLKMKFFPTPIVMPVNAVVVDWPEGGTAIRKIQAALVSRASDQVRDVIYPIVHEAEVGGLHVRNYLGLKRPGTDYRGLEKYSFDGFREEFKSLVERFVKNGGPTPVIVADELACATVVHELRKEHGAQKDKLSAVLSHAKLAFNGGPEAGNASPQMPRYFVAFAVNRDHKEWIDYLTDAFEFFLEANVELVALRYVDLHNSLGDRLGDVYSLNPRTGATTIDEGPSGWLGVGSKEASERDHGHWSNIVKRAYAILMEQRANVSPLPSPCENPSRGAR